MTTPAHTTRPPEAQQRLVPRFDPVIWVALVVLAAVTLTALVLVAVAPTAPSRPFPPAVLVCVALEFGIALFAIIRVARAAERREADLALRVSQLEQQSTEFEARAATAESESSRSRSLAEYLRTSNLELRESLSELAGARDREATAVKGREATEETLALVLSSAPFGFAIFDRDLRIERVNDAITSLTSSAPEAHPGNRMSDLAPQLAGIVEPVLRSVAETGAPRLGLQFDHALPTAPMQSRQWTLNAYPVRSPGGRLRVAAVFVDTTERKDLEAHLLHAQKMEAVGRLAGSIAHDFNNLLTAISAFAQFALEGVGESHPSRDDIAQIQLAAERGSMLTRRLLSFNRQGAAEPQSVDLNQLLDSLAGILRRILGEEIAVTTQFAPDVAQIHADPDQIEQALLNLALNARDAMAGHGTLTLETANVEEAPGPDAVDAPAGPLVMLTVRDTGSGMDASTQAHLFEPFFTTKPVGRGTGLGLAAVQDIVRQAGGSVSVTSERGRGSTFTMLFPQTVRYSTAVPSEPRKRPDAVQRTVLLVEDDAPVRHAVHRVLSRNGCVVHDAENGRQAVHAMERLQNSVDLIITDLVMPEMGGLEFAERVRARWPRTRVLFMSGYSDEAVDRRALIDAGAAFIEKPFTSEALLAKMRELLANVPAEPDAASGGAAA